MTKRLILNREKHYENRTMGTLTIGGGILHTIEQEWRPTAPGGEPENSCVPAGLYKLIPHKRPNGDEVVALVNPGLGVYYRAEDRPNGVGRYLILIHKGNWETDVVGCIAPGISGDDTMVTNSTGAMKAIMKHIGDSEAELLIREEL